jgi:hypothetical protein
VAFGHDKSYKNGTLHFYEKALIVKIATQNSKTVGYILPKPTSDCNKLFSRQPFGTEKSH